MAEFFIRQVMLSLCTSLACRFVNRVGIAATSTASIVVTIFPFVIPLPSHEVILRVATRLYTPLSDYGSLKLKRTKIPLPHENPTPCLANAPLALGYTSAESKMVGEESLMLR